MKNLMKKASALVLLVVLTLANVMVVGATEVKTNATHTYDAYQIFYGDYSEGTLSNLKWGAAAKNDTQAVTVGDLVPEEVLTELSAVKEKAETERYAVISKYFDKTSKNIAGSATGVSKETVKIEGLTPGYYVVVDTMTAVDASQSINDSISYYVVQVTSGVLTISPKKDVPSVTKEVSDDEADHLGWAKTADHELGEVFQFKLEASVDTSNLDKYTNAYVLTFHDTMSKGVKYDGNVKVYLDNTNNEVNAAEYTVDDAEAVAIAGTDKASFTVTINRLQNLVKDGLNHHIIVIYDAELTSDAMVNAPSNNAQNTENLNKVILEYSNDFESNGTGFTPEDTVWVFTYEIPSNKVDQDNKALAGAEFVLYKNDNGFKYAQFDENGKFLAWTEDVKDATPVKATEVKDANGVVTSYSYKYSGLDVGTYYLKETKTPAGFNTTEDIAVTVAAAHTVNNGEGVVNVSLTRNNETFYNITVVNRKGSLLPETGGIGTTIFYVVGGALVLFAAAALLIKKKRA